jgi:hypothetical protein
VTSAPDILGRWLPAGMQLGTATAALVLVMGLALGQPSLTWAGLLLLTLVPALQLSVAALGFASLGEVRSSVVAGAVLILLLAALAAAALLGGG